VWTLARWPGPDQAPAKKEGKGLGDCPALQAE
jgi:hypothetical protein